MRARLWHKVRLAWVFSLALLLVAPAPVAWGEPAAQGAFAKGTVVALRGTPHLWIADEHGVLHWGGDTRGLAGREINWNAGVELDVESIKRAARGDPWLSAGLLKQGDPIYLVKWETSEAVPRLLRIQSIADVESFGINGSNYGRFVIEKGEWERRFGISADRLERAVLIPATIAPPTAASQPAAAAPAAASPAAPTITIATPAAVPTATAADSGTGPGFSAILSEIGSNVGSFAAGLLAGEFALSWPGSDSLAFLAGCLGSSLFPPATVRDFAASALHGDAVGAITNAVGLLPALGDAEEIAAKLGRYLDRFPHMLPQAERFTDAVFGSVPAIRDRARVVFGNPQTRGRAFEALVLRKRGFQPNTQNFTNRFGTCRPDSLTGGVREVKDLTSEPFTVLPQLLCEAEVARHRREPLWIHVSDRTEVVAEVEALARQTGGGVVRENMAAILAP